MGEGPCKSGNLSSLFPELTERETERTKSFSTSNDLYTHELIMIMANFKLKVIKLYIHQDLVRASQIPATSCDLK